MFDEIGTGAKCEKRRLPERQVPSGNAYFGMLCKKKKSKNLIFDVTN
jgi:hypothetical protein